MALEDRVRTPRQRSYQAYGVAVAVALAVLFVVLGGDDDPPADTKRPAPTGDRVIAATPRVEVFQRRDLDDVLVLGAPYGVEDRGVLVTIDLATGDVTSQVTDGELWPAGFKDPTTDPGHPDAEAASRSPDGQHLAVFNRSTTNRQTGVSIYTEGSNARELHRLQSVVEVVSGRLVWSADSDAVYLVAASVDGSADRVIGIPVGRSPQTVVQLDELGFQWLAVE